MLIIFLYLCHIIDTDVVLPFTNVDRTASGQYTCSASNIVNGQTLSDSKTTPVKVICEWITSQNHHFI